MIQIRRAEERGHADHGWLNTWHSFSFNTYYDQRFMGYRSLRVINDDRVAPDKGFGMHPHQDMEIITYVLAGALEHKDSMGNGSVIRAGDVQRMSAGTGIVHSEFNPSIDEPVHLLQIWIYPEQNGFQPGYEQKTFSPADKTGRLCLIASPDGRDRSVSIHQDALLYATIVEDNKTLRMPTHENRHLWLHLARGQALLNDQHLHSGDGAAISGEPDIHLTGIDNAEVLIFDLP
jgi:redox-sensitive bicupin YhaK (pirin superfamily)